MSDDRAGLGRGESVTNPDDNELIRLRREKLDALRGPGLDPFGGRYPVTQWARDLAERPGNANDEELKGFGPVILAGRIAAMRRPGKARCAPRMDAATPPQHNAPADRPRRRDRAGVAATAQRPRPRPLPAHRPRALPQAPARGRLRARLRDQPELPERGNLDDAQPRVHDARVLSGVRRLRRPDGADG